MNLTKSIRKLRILALFLFLVPAIGLVGSVLIHNYLLEFKFEKTYNYKIDLNDYENSSIILCNKKNEFCKNRDANFNKFNKLGQCYKHNLLETFVNKDGINIEELKNDPSVDQNIESFNYEVYLKRALNTEIIDKTCIRNSNSLFLYNLFPFYYEFIHFLKKHKNTTFGTVVTINPFIKGETSISNIVKRFPLKFFFKPVLYVTTILMLLYWYYFNYIFQHTIKNKKNFYFFYFGILSAIFLFLHVFFLGWIFENEFLTKIRRTFVVFFILFEILAQAFLIKKILLIKDKIIDYLNEKIILIKLLFVIFVCLSTIIIFGLLTIYNFPPNVDYILEWNYFLILLIFYFLSFLLWKKIN